MTRIPLARTAAFSPFTSYLRQGGSDVGRLIRSLSLNINVLADQESLLPFDYASRFVEAVENEGGLKQFGLKVGARTSITDLGDFGLNLAKAPNLSNMLDRVVRTVPMTNSGAVAWIEEGKDKDSLSLNLKHDETAARASLDGFALLVLIDAVRMAAGPDWRPKHVSISAEAGDLSAYEAFSGAEVDREVTHIAFDIPRAYLENTLPEVELKRDFSIQQQMADTAPATDLVGSISQVVHSGLGNYLPSIEETAALAGMSIRSLQNSLKENNLVYRELTGKVRFAEAKRLLKESSLYINEIADHLGYNDTSNFNHAFKKWTGVSPKEFRKQAQAS